MMNKSKTFSVLLLHQNVHHNPEGLHFSFMRKSLMNEVLEKDSSNTIHSLGVADLSIVVCICSENIEETI